MESTSALTCLLTSALIDLVKGVEHDLIRQNWVFQNQWREVKSKLHSLASQNGYSLPAEETDQNKPQVGKMQYTTRNEYNIPFGLILPACPGFIAMAGISINKILQWSRRLLTNLWSPISSA